MGTIYQLTFFFALGLLAVIITIFVFAVSLLGRAMEAAARSERDKVAERKANNVEEMAAIRKEIQEAEASGQIPKGLTRKLDKLEKRDKKFVKELSKIRKAPESLTARRGVFYPCAFLVAALVLNGAAWYLSSVENINWAIPVSIWIIALAAIGYSIYRICKCLNVIQDVAITSEEAWIKKTVEAFKIAEKELDEERRPELTLIFREIKFPLHMKADSELRFELVLSVSKGAFAEDIIVFVGAPRGFDFPKQDTVVLGPHHDYPNYICRRWDIVKLIAGIEENTHVTIKSPPTTGNFKMVYYRFCRGHAEYSPTELDIIVE